MRMFLKGSHFLMKEFWHRDFMLQDLITVKTIKLKRLQCLRVHLHGVRE